MIEYIVYLKRGYINEKIEPLTRWNTMRDAIAFARNHRKVLGICGSLYIEKQEEGKCLKRFYENYDFR
jgi:hypothetical protein